MRALRWVLYGPAPGSDFIRNGASRCRVTLILSDGTHIVRERSSSVNRYLIRDPEGKERIFEGFGSDVPREVLEAHGMIPLQLDEDRELTLQIAQQLEGPFLLSESGGTRARSIGRISGAHLLDLAQNETARDQRAVSSRIRFVEEEMKRREEELKPYEVLPRFREQLNRAAALREEAGRKMASSRKASRTEGAMGRLPERNDAGAQTAGLPVQGAGSGEDLQPVDGGWRPPEPHPEKG